MTTLKIYVRDAETGNRVEMDVKTSNSVEDVIVSAASYWSKDPGAYVLRQGKRILQGDAVVSTLGLIDEDVLELMPDPEGGSARAQGPCDGVPSGTESHEAKPWREHALSERGTSEDGI